MGVQEEGWSRPEHEHALRVLVLRSDGHTLTRVASSPAESGTGTLPGQVCRVRREAGAH